MRLASEGIADAAAPAGTGHRAIVVAEGALAEGPQLADADRPVRKALGQQLLGAIETEIQCLHAAERIGYHHLRIAGAADTRLCRQLEGTTGTCPLYWRRPSTYSSTVEGTTAWPRKLGVGVSTR